MSLARGGAFWRKELYCQSKIDSDTLVPVDSMHKHVGTGIRHLILSVKLHSPPRHKACWSGTLLFSVFPIKRASKHLLRGPCSIHSFVREGQSYQQWWAAVQTRTKSADSDVKIMRVQQVESCRQLSEVARHSSWAIELLALYLSHSELVFERLRDINVPSPQWVPEFTLSPLKKSP